MEKTEATMKRTISTILAALLVASSLPALADPNGAPRHYRPDRHDRPFQARPIQPYGRDHYHHPGALWGVLGAGLALGAIAVTIEPPRPPVVMVPVVPAPPPGRLWYYCESARAYYPYVGYCPEGWRAVPATPY
jgi:hypothetical protein